MVDEVTQVVLRDALAICTGILLRCTWLIWRQWRGAVQEADIIYYHITHIADPSLGPEHHLTKDNKPRISSVCYVNTIAFLDSRVDV